ncbi:MAG: hypothetical protein SRB1_02012 [Desulfobacteraceae bacterium Eth-SRB1]|nr:MAG: hypothetical protein SRB1_02012 [Desulfobacteraceae bacterium Eth-SRB1]
MKKKVLMFFPSWGLGGSTIYLGQYVKSLVESGYKVDCVFRKKDKGSEFLHKLGGNLLFSKYPLSLSLTSAKDHNIVSLIYILKNFFKIIYGIIFSSYIILKRKPDIVFFGEYTMLQCFLPAWITIKKSIFFMQFDSSKNYYKRKIVEFILNKSNHVIAITKLHLEPIRFKKTSYQVIHNIVYEKGIIETAHLIRNLKIRNNEKIITFVGGFNPHKGTHLFIEIANKLCQLREDVIFLLIGPNNNISLESSHKSRSNISHYAKKVYNNIEKYNLVDRIRIIGETNSVISYLSESHLLVSCNTVAHFMRPVIEAWTQKIPVIVSDDIYGHYLVEHKINGCIADPTVESWVENINWILDDEERRQNLGYAGFKKYKAQFSEDNFNLDFAKLVEIIK